MKFYKLLWNNIIKKDGKPIRVRVYPKLIEDKDRILSAEERLNAIDISPPVLSDGAIVPASVLPLHESIVRPEGKDPIYKEVRIDDTEETKEIASSEERHPANKRNTA